MASVLAQIVKAADFDCPPAALQFVNAFVSRTAEAAGKRSASTGALLMGGMFVCGLIAAQWATKFDVQILRVLLNSSKFKPLYDPAKYQPETIRIRTNAAFGTNR